MLMDKNQENRWRSGSSLKILSQISIVLGLTSSVLFNLRRSFQELDLTAEALLLGDTSRAAPWDQMIQTCLKGAGDYVLVLILTKVFSNI